MVRRWKPLQDSDLKRKRHWGPIGLAARFAGAGASDLIMASSTIHSTSSASMTDDSNAKPVTVKVPIKLTPCSVQAEYHMAAGMLRPRRPRFCGPFALSHSRRWESGVFAG